MVKYRSALTAANYSVRIIPLRGANHIKSHLLRIEYMPWRLDSRQRLSSAVPSSFLHRIVIPICLNRFLRRSTVKKSSLAFTKKYISIYYKTLQRLIYI